MTDRDLDPWQIARLDQIDAVARDLLIRLGIPLDPDAADSTLPRDPFA